MARVCDLWSRLGVVVVGIVVVWGLMGCRWRWKRGGSEVRKKIKRGAEPQERVPCKDAQPQCDCRIADEKDTTLV